MSEANNKQVGGNHYQGEYQHWDWVINAGIDYLTGCATKYLMRYRKKNGLEDLKKAKHYMEKRKEVGVQMRGDVQMERIKETKAFLKANHHRTDKVGEVVLGLVYIGINMDVLLGKVDELITEYQAELDAREDNTGMKHPHGFEPSDE